MAIVIRSLQSSQVHTLDARVPEPLFDAEKRRFWVHDFRFDMWLRAECPRELRLAPTLWSEPGEYVFETAEDAQYFAEWLRTEGVAASGRMSRAPG